MIAVTVFVPNGISIWFKIEGKLSPRSYPIQYIRKWKYSFLSVTELDLDVRLFSVIDIWHHMQQYKDPFRSSSCTDTEFILF